MNYIKGIIIMTVILLSSCGLTDKSQHIERQNKEINDNDIVRKINMENRPNVNNERIDRETNINIANRLVERTSRVHGVNDATAVVIGDFAFIGIDVDEDLDRSEVSTIKYTVAESFKDDSEGKRAVVIADPDLKARLSEVADDFRKGKPIEGIMDELAEITGRLIPELPNDIRNNELEDDENAPEKEREKLNNKEEDQLEKYNERHSDDL